MKKTAITSILPYLKDSKFIGYGCTSICFLMKNNRVLKLYINTDCKNRFFGKKDNII